MCGSARSGDDGGEGCAVCKMVTRLEEAENLPGGVCLGSIARFAGAFVQF